MAKNAGEKTRKAEARADTGTGDTVHNDEVGAEAGADYEAAYEHAVAGRTAEAEAICRKILASDPTRAEALHLLGAIAAKSGNAPSAIELFNRALAAKPDFAKAHSNLGALLLRRGEVEEAVTHFEQAIEIEPDYAEAHNNLGNALMKSGRFGDAAKAFERAVQLEPDNALAYNNLGAVLLRQGRENEAIARFKKAMELEPDLAMAHNNLGNALHAEGRPDEAEESFSRALSLDPGLAQVHINLGNVFKAQGKFAEAAKSYLCALDIKPTPGIKVKLATLLPIIPESKDALIRARQRFEAQVDALSKTDLSLDDPYKEVGATNFHLAYHGMNDRDVQQAVARLYLKACPSLAWSAPTPTRRGRTRLRIGFVSHYLRDHVVSWNFRGSIEQLDRSRFEVVVFTSDYRADVITHQLRANADHAVTLPKDLARARDAIAAQALDVLVYTDIGMDPLTYFLAFARLAPVQCVMAGHPVTTGIPNVDYFISTEASEPPGAEAHYSETLVRLAGSLVYFHRPTPPARPRTREDFGFGASEHLYACPQSLFKFHPDFDAILAAILRRDGAGRLVLVEGKIPTWTKLLSRRLAKSMPDVIDRVRWLPRLSFNDFLSLLILSDVLLDPLHFGGGTTTRQSFAFNKPVVTLPGDFLRGRGCYGSYRRMDLTECVAKDADGYVDIAVRLGTDPDWRREVETRIAAASPVLYENPGGVRELEEFFLTAAAKAGVR